MKHTILTALMALILSACASHHRDVASVENEAGTESATGRSEHAVIDGLSDRGGAVR